MDGLPLFAMLKGQMDYSAQRQRVVAQNVANADTPGYTPTDLKPYAFADVLRGSGAPGPVAPSLTHAAHLEGRPLPPASPWKPAEAPDSETRLDGNQVVLEEQMMKMQEARADQDAAITLYQQSLTMLRTALRKPGG